MIVMEAAQETVPAALAREVSVLSSLAHCGWLNTQQLQALCFHGFAISTVRTTLRYFEEAGWVHHVRWRVGSPDGGHIWAILPKGVRVLERYLPVTPQLMQDLSRPSSALEQEEWRVQLAVRSFVTRFVLEARHQPLLATASVTLPTNTRRSELDCPRIEPDVSLFIEWERQTTQSSNWLPWTSPPSACGRPTQYALYCDRTVALSYLPWLIRTWTASVTTEPRIIVLLLNSEDRQVAARNVLNELDSKAPLRVAIWADLEHGIFQGNWRNGVDQPTSFQALDDLT